jgi:hypothetical protein
MSSSLREFWVAKTLAPRLGGLQGSGRPRTDYFALVLGDGGQDVDGQLVRVRVIDRDELHAGSINVAMNDGILVSSCSVSSDADSRVIRFRSRTDASHRSQRGKAPIGYSGPDYSPVPNLSKYECPESEDEYRHRMVINAVALVFVSLLSLAGFWLVNVIAHS